MHLNEAGKIVLDVWNSLPARFPQIQLGTAQVMPDHFHGIIEIHQTASVTAIHELPSPIPSPMPQRMPRAERRRMTLPLVVGYFKMNTAKRINQILGSEGSPVWQQNYYEHIVRDEVEYNKIHLYIEANVVNWVRDNEP